MSTIDQAVSQVERLYERLTGKPVRELEHKKETLHTDVDLYTLLESRTQELLLTLQDPTVMQLMRPWTPAMSAWENETHYMLRLEIPGVKRENVDISVRGNMLVVSGTRKVLAAEKGFQPAWNEIPNGSFQRTILLPFETLSPEINSTMNDGVLEITIAKQDMASKASATSKKTKVQ